MDAPADLAGSIRPRWRMTKAALFVAAVMLLAHGVFSYAFAFRLPSCDDLIWLARSQRWPLHCEDARDYAAGIDVPGINRWSYGVALRSAGFESLDSLPPEETLDPRVQPPLDRATWLMRRRAYSAMRFANALAMAGFLVLLWYAASAGLGSKALALLAVAPLAASHELRVVVTRIGPDAFLAFGLALTLAAWQYFHSRGAALSWRAVILVGAASGLATSGKLNGGLGVLAFVAYLACRSHGWGRLTRPTVACAAGFAVFAIVNPVVFFSGRAPWTVIHDILVRRVEVVGFVNAALGHFTRREILDEILPYWLVTLPLLALVQLAAARRFAWMEPAIWWGAFLFAGTAFTINVPVEYYIAPAHAGLFFPSALAAIALVRRWLAANLVMTRRAPGAAPAEPV